jgi:hypothetical protein
MKKRIIKMLAKNRENPMNFEVVLSREFFHPLDKDGNEKNVSALNFRVRYCVREEGSEKILKCFATHEKAKKFIREMEDEAIKAKEKKNKKEL